MKRVVLFTPLIVLVIFCGFFLWGLKTGYDPSHLPSALLNKPFPSFRLPSLQDNLGATTHDKLKGEITLVNVWATWCVACREEHPYLNQLKQEGMRIVGLNYKDDSNAARQWLNDLGNPYQWNIVDQDGRLGIDLGVYGAPETYLLDQNALIRVKHVGVLDQDVWDEKFLSVIHEIKGSGD